MLDLVALVDTLLKSLTGKCALQALEARVSQATPWEHELHARQASRSTQPLVDSHATLRMQLQPVFHRSSLNALDPGSGR